jgi:hypothetical protein
MTDPARGKSTAVHTTPAVAAVSVPVFGAVA